MPTTEQHARNSTTRSAGDPERLVVPAWPSRDLERRSTAADRSAAADTSPDAARDTDKQAEPAPANGGFATTGGDPGAQPGDPNDAHAGTPAGADTDARTGATDVTGATEMTETTAPSAATTMTSAVTSSAATSPWTMPTAPTSGADPRTAPRRANTFLADLTRAMRVAAEEEREDVLVRFREDARAFVDAMRAEFALANEQARERADNDVASLEEWCAAELERIRRETEQGIEARRARLDAELAAQTTRLDEGVAQVSATVASFEHEMATFFERLLVEEEPSTFAVMARQLPDPPAFTAWPAGAGLGTAEPESSVVVEPDLEMSASESFDAEALAAAEAEAAEAMAREGFDVTAPGASAAAPAVTAAAPAQTRMSIAAVGLVSVASVSAFKRVLSRIDGVRAVQVSSGPQGEFIFTLTCSADLDLADAVGSLPGFEVEVRASGDASVSVVAHDLDQGE